MEMIMSVCKEWLIIMSRTNNKGEGGGEGERERGREGEWEGRRGGGRDGARGGGGGGGDRKETSSQLHEHTSS